MDHSFLDRLRGADDATKRRWIFGLSVLVMAIIVGVWLAYFNSLLKPAVPASATNGFSIGDSVTGGFAATIETLKSGMGRFVDIFKASRSYSITP